MCVFSFHSKKCLFMFEIIFVLYYTVDNRKRKQVVKKRGGRGKNQQQIGFYSKEAENGIEQEREHKKKIPM